MQMGFRRPRGAIIQRELQYLTRAFPSRYVTIYRESSPPTFSRKGQHVPGTSARETVFSGIAIYIPAGGVVELFGGGQVERTSPTLVLSGNYPVEQGDFVALDGRTFQVEHPLNHHGEFVEVRLQQHRQSV